MEVHDNNKKLPDSGSEQDKIIKDKSLAKMSNSQYVNQLLQYYEQNNISIKLKKCKQWVQSSNSYYPIRRGRFAMDRGEYNNLVHRAGYYLFIVENEGEVMMARLIKANTLDYSSQITWNTLFGR